ncbi:universal stress protein Slr1101-like [Gigantopelta aegis]|uniref:universal stress protein Slr1101-like n=1 Tax=Gigantopelta aegis TaxID=1735272 RepID=UPI001B88DB4A|nr:universal stress protein Slr1101-like [Gigantopelta aegis]
MIDEANAKSDHLKRKFLQKINENNVTGEFVALDETKVGRAVCEFDNKVNANYIVTGTRGLGKVRRTLIGSVSDYIIHHSHSPVVVCRPPVHHDDKHHH